jgi:hypothetical protein
VKLRTAQSEYEHRGPKRGAESVLNIWIERGGIPPHMPTTEQVATSPTVQVRANHGRWIVDCPFCPSAQVAAFDDHRFFCTDCGNKAVLGKFVAIEWPSEAEQIDDVLSARLPENANWRADENVAHLRAENAAHGLGDA